MRDENEVRILIEQMKAGFAVQKRIQWAITRGETDTVCGLIGFGYLNQYHRMAFIGFDLARSHWGKGIVTEAARAVIQFGFEQMQLNRIEPSTIVDHAAAVRVLEKLGFQREGTKREFSLEDDGEFHDDAFYGLLRREFTP